MKLELKHLAPYLPYKIKCLYTHTNKAGTISNVYTIGEGFDNEDIKLSIDYSEGEHIWMFKPILRPLSDLTKEVEVNGEKFIPIIELAKLFHTNKSALTHFTNIVDAGFYGISVNCHIENDDSRFTYYQLRNSEFVLSNTYEEIQKLFEWHFDVFGLIEKNLAIDINTL